MCNTISCRRKLELKGVVLSNFLNESFNGFLHSISLVNCNLTLINPNTFTQLDHLLSINISYNRVTYLHQTSFTGLNELTTIDLSNNRLSSLPSGIFDEMKTVEYMYLHGNKLTSIPDMLFKNMWSLIHIDLSYNRLVTVSDYAISDLNYVYYQFTSIDLSRNCLTEISIWLFYLDSIAEIDISGNKISFQSIRTILQKIVNVQNVSDTHMEVDFLRGSKSINLRYNAFTSFDISTLDNVLSYAFSTFFLRVQLNFGEFVFNCDCRMHSLYQFMNSAGIFTPRP